MTPGPLPDAPIERIRHHLVGLRMPRALETLDAVIQQLERGQIGAIEAIDTLLAEEFTVREGRRIKAALQMARLATIKTISGFDFSFQPSLDRNRIMALAALDFIDRHEVVHLIGQSGTGKSHLAIALGVEAIRAGRSVYFSPLADILDSLAKAEREGRLRERIRYLCRSQLLIIDEIGYLRMERGFRRSRRRHSLAGQAFAPRRRRADRGLQLPDAPACRPAAAGTTSQPRGQARRSHAAASPRPPAQGCQSVAARAVSPVPLPNPLQCVT